MDELDRFLSDMREVAAKKGWRLMGAAKVGKGSINANFQLK